MTDSQLDPLLRALRDDLPSEHDAARIRARLVGAGVLAAGVATPAAAAGASGWLGKLALLPLGAKIGLAVAATSLALAPVAYGVVTNGRAPRGASTPAAPAPARTTPTVNTAAAPARDARAAAPVGEESAASPADLAAPQVTRERVRSLPDALPAKTAERPVEPEPAPAGETAAVGSFPLAAAAGPARDEGTLRAETALMERALAALGAGDRAAARRLLQEHATRFPNGLLAPERARAFERLSALEAGADAGGRR
jgi:hypothetical protein